MLFIPPFSLPNSNRSIITKINPFQLIPPHSFHPTYFSDTLPRRSFHLICYSPIVPTSSFCATQSNLFTPIYFFCDVETWLSFRLSHFTPFMPRDSHGFIIQPPLRVATNSILSIHLIYSLYSINVTHSIVIIHVIIPMYSFHCYHSIVIIPLL